MSCTWPSLAQCSLCGILWDQAPAWRARDVPGLAEGLDYFGLLKGGGGVAVLGEEKGFLALQLIRT